MPEPTPPSAAPPGAAPAGGIAPGAAAAPGTAPAGAPAAPALPACGPDEVALLVDGRPVVVKKGTTVLQAAERIGIVVPHYCYHAALSIAGNCRMCLVEIEKMPKLQIGCATTVAQGMVVKTTTPRVKSTREGIMEFLLINHPLDCPICDQAGECRLQQYSAQYGTGESRFVDEKIHHDKRVPLGAQVVFDGERCIKCTRCVRFCDEVTKTHELALFDRGGHAIIGAFPDRPLDNPYSGNTVDICPVGALTWKPFRFHARVWFLKDVPSVCLSCARGCNVNLAVFENRIHRITPRRNDEVNGHWMCDAGRESHEPPAGRTRLRAPLLRGEPGVAAAGAGADAMSAALDRATGLLRAAGARHGASAVAVLASARLSVEDLYALKRLADAAGWTRVVLAPHDEGQDDDLLIRRDRTPNARGARLLGFAEPAAPAAAALFDDVAAGRVRALLTVGEDPIGDGRLVPAAARGLEALVAIDAYRTPTVEAAHAALPATALGEADGVYVNCAGRAQRARQALRAAGLAEPAWRLFLLLGGRFGLAADWRSAAVVFDEAAASTPAFAGLSHRALGDRGRPVREA